MRKNALFLALTTSVALVIACGENGRLPTDAYEIKNVTASATACVSYEQTRLLAVTLFGDQGNGSTPKKLDGVKAKLDVGNLPEARTLGMNLIKFITNEARAKHISGTPAQITQLVNQILCLISLPSVAEAVDAFVVIPTDPQDTVVNSAGTGGVVIPPNAVSEPTIITIAPIAWTDTTQGSGPLITKLDQYPGYFHFSKISATGAPFLQPVVVAVCPSASVPVSIRQKLRLGHQAASGPSGFELPPPANADFLSCPVSAGPAVMASATTQSEAYTRIGKRASGIALDATGGVGGTTGTFSDFGTVDGTLSATGGVGGTTGTFIQLGDQKVAAIFDGRPLAVAPCSEAPLASAVAQSCRPTVSITTLLGTKLQNVPVSFSVTQGGGKTAPDAAGTCGAFNTSALVTTNNLGVAIACWNLGPAAGMNTIVATPSTGGDVPATAVFSPATLTFNVNGAVVDNTPPVIAVPVVTGTVGKNGWYTSDVSVTWAVSDPETSVTSNGCSATLNSNSAGTTFTCSATNAVGLTSTRSLTIKLDKTLATVSGTVIGRKGNNEWYVSDVNVKWSVAADGVSGSGASTGCGDQTVSENGQFTYECIAETGAGLSSTAKVAFKRDASIPVIDGSLLGTPGKAGWFVSNVGVHWAVSNNGPSGIGFKSGCEDLTLDANGSFNYTCTAESGAGVSATRSMSVSRDATVPTVAFTVTGDKGDNNWYVSNVGIDWAFAATGPSGMGETNGCSRVALATDGEFNYECTVESGAGLSATARTSVKRDAAPPVLAVALSGAPGKNNWFISNVGVDWTVTPGGPSGVGSVTGCTDLTLTENGEVTYDCAARSVAGLNSTKTINVKRDVLAPTVGVALGGSDGKGGWFTSNVLVDWTVAATGPSGIGEITNCDDFTVNTNGEFSYDCVAESGAGVKAIRNTKFKRDASIPTVVAIVDGTKGKEDWFVTPVQIGWTVTPNGPSDLGVRNGCIETTVNVDGAFSYSCSVESGAGLLSETKTAAGKRDLTPPVVGYSGNLGSYGVDNTVNIICSAVDATSGVASTTCFNIQGAAYNYPLGLNARFAEAVDHAGNKATASTQFTVVLTTSNLCSLTRSFSTSSNSSSSLCVKLNNAAAASARGDLSAKAGMISAFINEVSAQRGKTLTSAQADVLTRLARML